MNYGYKDIEDSSISIKKVNRPDAGSTKTYPLFFE